MNEKVENAQYTIPLHIYEQTTHIYIGLHDFAFFYAYQSPIALISY